MDIYKHRERDIYNNNCEPGVLLGVDNEKYFSTFNLQGLTKEKFLEELQIEFEETIKSIEKYGGFYIGRYETGDITQNDKVPVVKRLNSNTEMDQASWYHEYNILKNIQIKDNVKSNMIWGCLWDETLQWLVDSGNKTNEEIINSSIWGNHKGVDIEYITASGNVRTKYGNEEYNNIPTGSSEYSNSNNIYDIAGNGTEITLEKRPNFEVQRMSRGGTTTTTAEKESVSFRRISDVGNRAGSSMVRSTCILIYKIKVAKKIIFSKP